LSVADALKSVHPSGQNISHSTHVGFSLPPATVPRFGDFLAPCVGPLSFQSLAFGVGQNPYPLATVRRSDIVRSQHTPFRIEPQRGQVTEDSAKSANSEGWGVLHEHEARSYLANDAGKLSPKAASLAVDSRSCSGNADVLTGKAARNDINTASPRSSVKGANVVPNRERRETSIILSGEQSPSGIGVKFDGAHGSPSEQMPAEYSSTSAREKSQLIHCHPPLQSASSRC
jgi:hypothetical protein